MNRHLVEGMAYAGQGGPGGICGGGMYGPGSRTGGGGGFESVSSLVESSINASSTTE